MLSDGRSSSVLLSGFLLILAAGCVEPVKLEVVPVQSAAPVTSAAPCDESRHPVSCLSAREPWLRLQFDAGDAVRWLRASPDGRTVIAAVAPKSLNPMARPAPGQGISFVAFDTTARKELWRIRLSQNAVIDADEVHFVDPDKVVLKTTDGVLFGLDRQIGREVWRYPTALEKAPSPAITLLYDPEGQYFVAGAWKSNRIIDAQTGQQRSNLASFHQGWNQRVTGGVPYRTDTDIFFYDYGLVRVDRAKKDFAWGRKFATFGEDDYRGANVGMAVAGALLGVSSGSIPPDWMVGRNTQPVIAGDRILTSALGVVHALDAKTGNVLWSKDLGVPQIGALEVRGDRVYALAGGQYIFWHGRQGMTVREPIRYGVYALQLSDGSPVAGFRSPFNTNVVRRSMTMADVEKFDAGDAFEEEEDWGSPAKPAASAAPAAAGSAAFSTTRLVGMGLAGDRLLVATKDDAILLDSSGRESKRVSLKEIGPAMLVTPVGNRLVVRGQRGVAVFDRTSGELSWKRTMEPGGALNIPNAHPGHAPFVRTLPWKTATETELRHFGSSIFWVDEKSDSIIVPVSGPKLAALRISDGQPLWEMATPATPILDRTDRGSYLYLVDGNVAEVYRLPAGG